MNWSEHLPRIIEALIVLVTGIGLWLQNRSTKKHLSRKLDDNTQKTEAIQIATVDRLDYDRLRRMEAALLTLPGCQQCRDEIASMTERRRLYPQTKRHE